VKVAAENEIQFEIPNDGDAGRLSHEVIREQIKAWVREGGGNDVKSRQIWAATWEALQNAIRYGSQRGDPIRITLARDADELRIRVTQPKSWNGAQNALAKVREEAGSRDRKLRLGGLFTMSKLASRLRVSNRDRTIEMRFGGS
jgi:anti-sigma regulatory factor (Ser/Thr protein kinase)